MNGEGGGRGSCSPIKKMMGLLVEKFSKNTVKAPELLLFNGMAQMDFYS